MYVLYYYLVSFYFVQCILNDCIGLILFFGKHNGKSVNIKYKYNIQPFSLEIVQLINSLYCTIAGCCLNIQYSIYLQGSIPLFDCPNMDLSYTIMTYQSNMWSMIVIIVWRTAFHCVKAHSNNGRAQP